MLIIAFLLLQIFGIGLRVNILLEVVANVHQHLPINKEKQQPGPLVLRHRCYFVQRRLTGTFPLS